MIFSNLVFTALPCLQMLTPDPAAGWNAANYRRSASKGAIERRDTSPIIALFSPLARWDPSPTSTLPAQATCPGRPKVAHQPTNTFPCNKCTGTGNPLHHTVTMSESHNRRNLPPEKILQRGMVHFWCERPAREKRLNWNSCVSAWWPDYSTGGSARAAPVCPYQPFGEWPVPGRYTKPAHRHCITPTSLLPPLDWPLGQIASICFLSSPILRDIWGGEDILGWSSIVHLQLPLCSTPHSPNNSHTVAHPATYFPPKLSFRCYLRQILSFHLFIKGSICLLESCGGLCNHL